MIDIHTHILPELDDGSRNVEESVKMLGMLSGQGVDTVVATPHFYIDNTSITDFLELRDASLKKLTASTNPEERPQIALGAEVQFFPDMYAMDEIEKLCISGTRYMLVEMPFSRWSGYVYKTLTKLFTARGITPIVAHVERYLDFQDEEDVDVLRKLKETNSLIQINSGFLTWRNSRRRALNLVKRGLVNFMGSDCHNMESRPPEIRSGYDVIYKKLGERGIDAFAYWAEKLKDKLDVV